MRENIEMLIASGITAYQVNKETGLPKNTAYRIFNGEADLDNVSLKNAEILNGYYLKLKGVGKPELTKVIVADNGDVIFEHNNQFEKLSEVNVYELKQMAIAKLEVGEYSKCETKEGSYEGIEYLSYYASGEFLGTADMHVTNKFNTLQNLIYLKRSSEKLGLGRVVDAFKKVFNEN